MVHTPQADPVLKRLIIIAIVREIPDDKVVAMVMMKIGGEMLLVVAVGVDLGSV